jgi:hypothetical protein
MNRKPVGAAFAALVATTVLHAPALRALEASKKICRACMRGVRMFLYIELVGRASTCDAKSS